MRMALLTLMPFDLQQQQQHSSSDSSAAAWNFLSIIASAP
jgi:hypothetical protein